MPFGPMCIRCAYSICEKEKKSVQSPSPTQEKRGKTLKFPTKHTTRNSPKQLPPKWKRKRKKPTLKNLCFSEPETTMPWNIIQIQRCLVEYIPHRNVSIDLNKIVRCPKHRQIMYSILQFKLDLAKFSGQLILCSFRSFFLSCISVTKQSLFYFKN